MNNLTRIHQGLYRVHWKEEYHGGFSLAAIGQYGDGCYWLAPTNWINGAVPLSEQIDKIDHLDRLEIADD